MVGSAYWDQRRHSASGRDEVLQDVDATSALEFLVKDVDTPYAFGLVVEYFGVLSAQKQRLFF